MVYWTNGLREPMVRNRMDLLTLFVDNLPPSMSNIWLHQLFNNDGKVIDAFVSKKARPKKKGSFRFVRLSRVREAIEAIKRNNGLMVKGYKIVVVMSKYQLSFENTTQNMKSHRAPMQNTHTKKVWRRSKRDARTYSQVARLVVGGNETIQIPEWLKNIYICNEDESLELQQAMEKKGHRDNRNNHCQI